MSNIANNLYSEHLWCTDCETWTGFELEDGKNAVTCRKCGKRHSRNSIHSINRHEYVNEVNPEDLIG